MIVDLITETLPLMTNPGSFSPLREGFIEAVKKNDKKEIRRLWEIINREKRTTCPYVLVYDVEGVLVKLKNYRIYSGNSECYQLAWEIEPMDEPSQSYLWSQLGAEFWIWSKDLVWE